VLIINDGLPEVDCYLDHPLATGLDVLTGHAQVTVPNVAPGNKYQIIGEFDYPWTNRCPKLTFVRQSLATPETRANASRSQSKLKWKFVFKVSFVIARF
jgi:hypothetical protein